MSYLQLAKVTMQSLELAEKLEEAVTAQNFAAAAELKDALVNLDESKRVIQEKMKPKELAVPSQVCF